MNCSSNIWISKTFSAFTTNISLCVYVCVNSNSTTFEAHFLIFYLGFEDQPLFWRPFARSSTVPQTGRVQHVGLLSKMTLWSASITFIYSTLFIYVNTIGGRIIFILHYNVLVALPCFIYMRLIFLKWFHILWETFMINVTSEWYSFVIYEFEVL